MTNATPTSRFISVATVCFFVALLVTGLLLFRDYGITWDEVPTRQFGLMNVEHRVPDLHTLDSVRKVSGPSYERFGPAFEILLVRIEKLMQPTDIRNVMYMRHLATFLVFFAGVGCFHQLCRRRFGDGLALLACVCLAASPQIFSHAFYNIKDISFLTMFVAAMLSLDEVLARPTWRSALLHVLTTVLLLGARVLGVFAMLLTGVSAIARRPRMRTIYQLVGYGLLVGILLPLVWPVLRIDYVHIVLDAVLGTTTNPYGGADLFRGQAIDAKHLPWDYAPTWMIITTPMVISALFVFGVVSTIGRIARAPAVFLRADQRDALVLCWFFLPVLGCMVLRPILYDAWRHLFFVYPAAVYLGAAGMQGIVTFVTTRVTETRKTLVPLALTALLFLALSPVVSFMVKNHPYEHLYFNRFAGRDMQQVKQQFELDYWGLSNRESLEYIARTDTASTIRLYVTSYPGRLNIAMLDPRDRRRFALVRTPEEAEYFVTDYRFHPAPFPFPWEIYSVRVGDASINSVFGSTALRARLQAAHAPEHTP